MPATFVVSKSPKGEFSFLMIANNGDKILASETYTSRALCHAGILLVRQNASRTHMFEKKSTQNHQHYFVLTDSNSSVIATSELFWSSVSRDYAMKIVIREAPDGLVEEDLS